MTFVGLVKCLLKRNCFTKCLRTFNVSTARDTKMYSNRKALFGLILIQVRAITVYDWKFREQINLRVQMSLPQRGHTEKIHTYSILMLLHKTFFQNLLLWNYSAEPSVILTALLNYLELILSLILNSSCSKDFPLSSTSLMHFLVHFQTTLRPILRKIKNKKINLFTCNFFHLFSAST